MDAEKCEAFLIAMEKGSLTAAANFLNYTQSGITRMISSLEREIGFPLFIRSKKGVRLTENGKLMVPLLRSIVNATHNAEQFSSEILGITRGALTIGCYYSISAMWMPKILKEFQSHYPGITIRVQEGGNREMSEWLNKKSIDCCLCATPTLKNCDWIPIFQDELVAWLPHDHPFASKDFFPIKNLDDYPFIYTSLNHDTDQDRLISTFNLHPQICFTTRDAYSTYNMVESGLGISFNQRLISKKWGGSVAEVPFYPSQFVNLGIAVPSLGTVSLATKKFIGCVRNTI